MTIGIIWDGYTVNPGGCETNSCSYRIICIGCERNQETAHYEGETGRNPFSRGLEHKRDLKNEKEESPLWKHCQLVHDGRKQEFTMKVLGSFKSCLQRQTNEAVRIVSSEAKYIMNSRSEFHQAPITRVVVSSGLELEQGEETVGMRGRGRGNGGRRSRGQGRLRGT